MEINPMNTMETVEETIHIGEKKAAKTHGYQTLIAGILAGTFIALGSFAAATAAHAVINPGLAKFVAGAIFPVGLILIIICGGELFTGNTLLFLANLEKKITTKQMLRNWSIVYVGNFIGALVIALLIYASGLLASNNGLLAEYLTHVADKKSHLTLLQAFSSGILCNLLVCLAVWGAYASKDVVGKILMIWFPVMAFIVSGFEHSVANMYYFTTGALLGSLDWSGVAQNMVAVTLGNIVGGAFYVGLAYWAGYKYIPNLYTMKKHV